jgi:hypothetical protein
MRVKAADGGWIVKKVADEGSQSRRDALKRAGVVKTTKGQRHADAAACGGSRRPQLVAHMVLRVGSCLTRSTGHFQLICMVAMHGLGEKVGSRHSKN